ncbi:hypothetical protein [Mycobacteroides chelonae]|uniref:DUF7214 domain-containing protein n=1 Tax=Mycobacteroides chelonae TaxID=1774 RepID=UPI000A95EFD9|nr:hypothetical protein [Mycobacteroides chelonae]
MKIETTTNDDGLRVIRAIDGTGSVAMAIEHADVWRDGDHTLWHLVVVDVPDSVSVDPSRGPYPEVRTEHAAIAWVRFLAELVQRAKRVVPVWCPDNSRQVADELAEHASEPGLEVIQ